MSQPPPTDADRPGPLYRDIRLDHSVVMPVIGVPVTFVSNRPAGIAAAEESFGFWRAAGAGQGADPSLRVSIVIHPGDEGGHTTIPVSWRMGGPKIIVAHTPGSVGIVDLAHPQVTMYVTETLLADRLHFCHGMLEALVLTAVNTLDRTPLHAAALAKGDAVLLLSGQSGTGKSTLVYAALGAGFKLLAEDALYVQQDPAIALWGSASRVCLLPDTRRHFPELNQVQAGVLSNGKTKMVVPVAPGRRATVPAPANRLVVVILERGGETATLRPATSDEIRSSLAADLDLTRTLFGTKQDDLVGWLAQRPGWCLRLSSDPRESVPLLEELASRAP